MRTALFQLCRVSRSSLLVLSVLVTLAPIAVAAGAEPELPSAIFPRLDLAQRALDLEKRGKYREALDLLQKLHDADFVTQPADGATQPVGNAGAARASVTTLLAEAETLRKESPEQ